MSKATPWTIEKAEEEEATWQIRADSFYIATVYGCLPGDMSGEKTAALLHRAPMLRDALRELLEHCERIGMGGEFKKAKAQARTALDGL